MHRRTWRTHLPLNAARAASPKRGAPAHPPTRAARPASNAHARAVDSPPRAQAQRAPGMRAGAPGEHLKCHMLRQNTRHEQGERGHSTCANYRATGKTPTLLLRHRGHNPEHGNNIERAPEMPEAMRSLWGGPKTEAACVKHGFGTKPPCKDLPRNGGQPRSSNGFWKMLGASPAFRPAMSSAHRGGATPWPFKRLPTASQSQPHMPAVLQPEARNI